MLVRWRTCDCCCDHGNKSPSGIGHKERRRKSTQTVFLFSPFLLLCPIANFFNPPQKPLLDNGVRSPRAPNANEHEVRRNALGLRQAGRERGLLGKLREEANLLSRLDHCAAMANAAAGEL